MRYVKNEKGNSFIYLLWLMTTIIVIMLIVVNIARVYVVKQQASTAAQLGALAGTSELLLATEEAIKDFDRIMIENLAEGEDYDPLWEFVTDRIDELEANGKSYEEAYIKALNEIIPGKISDPILKGVFTNTFSNTALSTKIYGTVQRVVKENEGNEEHLEVKISTEKYRVEVKTDATFNTVTDGSRLASFSEDIEQKGYGPSLLYLKDILN